MASYKADKRFFKRGYRTILILIMFLGSISNVWAAITNQTVVLSSDLNGDGIAGIGDTITFSCRSTTAQPDQYPYVDLSALGNPYFALPNIAGSFYSAFLTVSPGSLEDNNSQTFQFVDEGGPRPGYIRIDNMRPYSQLGPSAAPGDGNGGYYMVGDDLVLQITMNSPLDGDIPRANLTGIGLGASHQFSRVGGSDSNPDYQLTLPFPIGKEGVATPITVSATDNAGNSRTWDLSVNYDTKAPVIESATVVNLTSGKQWITAGDSIKIQAVISNYDNDVVKASNSAIIPEGPVTMQKVAGGTPGASAVYEYIHYVQEDPEIQGFATAFQITATDDVNNTSDPRMTNYIKIDTLPPEFEDVTISLIEKNGILNDGVGIIGDELYIYGDLSQVMDDVILTVDLSGIGGVSNQILSLPTGTTTFKLNYDIHQYTSENSTPRAFTVLAKDTAGNEISRVTLPIVYIDNSPPVISAGQVQNVSRPGQSIRYGDNISIQANLTNIDNGSIWTNFERIGGTASSTLSPYSGTIYRLEHTVGDPTFGLAYDQNVSFTIYAVDDSGNMVQTVANSVAIDNEKPKILGSTYTSSPAISATHPYVKTGDRLTFIVGLASASASVHDSETVKITLTEFGETAPVDMIYDGVGSYTLTVDVPAGDLNYDHYFAYRVEDNSGNAVSGNIKVKIDNKNPDLGPMAVNYLTDQNVSGIVNVGDSLEFIIPAADQDFGTCTIDLSYVGGSSAQVMNYDPVLLRYYLIHDCVEAAQESTSYVFRATATDKAFNTMNSLSSTFKVDCRPPDVMYASATPHIELKGNPTVVNVGDKVKIIAKVDLSKLDGGTPMVNLTRLGGNAAQTLYDDGAHSDNLANDGIYGYEHTVVAGSTDGENVSLTVEIIDNAGNRDIASTETMFVDNKPLTITSCTNTQIFDNNGNSIVDLDGMYTTHPTVATDVVRLEVDIQGNAGDMGTMTVDLTKLGRVSDTALEVPYVSVAGGWKASADYSPIEGTTNDEEVQLTVKLTDVNGNETIQTCTNKFRVDNRPPKLEIYPIAFLVDEGRLGEANLNDVIRIRLKISNNDDILPMIDFTNLYQANGMVAPSPTLFPPPTLGEYIYDWTVPEGLGTIASLTILAYDASGNMKYGYTNEIRFLSKTPSFADFPQTRADLSIDANPAWEQNRIANPGDQVTLTVVLSSLYNTNNSPPATVTADIRSLKNTTQDDASSAFADGNLKTYWTALTYQPAPISAPGNYVYSGSFTVEAGGIDADIASFGVRVLHPDASSIVLASTTIQCDPDNAFGIDTLIPDPQNIVFSIYNENNDNIASSVANINDLLYVKTDINKFDDPGSATAIILRKLSEEEVFRTPLYQIPGTKTWEAFFNVATASVNGGWPEFNLNEAPRVRIIASDDADNFISKTQTATFTVDNVPPVIVDYRLHIVENNQNTGVANIGDGYLTGYGDNVAPDSLIASLTVTGADLNDKGRAYIDLTPINGTSTYPLDVPSATTIYSSQPFALATNTFDLATRTFNIYVIDNGGNRAQVAVELAVDTTRPKLESATYNGQLLTLNLSERINPLIFQERLDRVRISRKPDCSITQVNSKAAVELDPDKDLIMEDYESSQVSILLSSGTKAIIADWGNTSLYISLASNEGSGGEADPGDTDGYIALDLSGNWLQPIPRTPATFSITIPADFTDRPHLVSGSYDGNNPEYLYLQFDKEMDLTTITDDTLENLAIWRDRSNPVDQFSNRYRFAVAATDTVEIDDPDSAITEVTLRLSQEAQDWIALNYTRIGTQFHLQINGSQYEPPEPTDPAPLIRDFSGNRVMPIQYNVATPGTLIPLNTQFAVQWATLDLTGGKASLKIGFDNTARVRMYTDTYPNSATNLTLTRNNRVDLSRVYIYANSDLTGGSISLNQNMVDDVEFKTVNTDYASTTVTIPLSDDALKSMLSWGTSRFYLACSEKAFVDLWGNGNIRYPSQGNQATEITNDPVIEAGTYPPPRIHTVAVSPAKESATLGYTQMLFKGQPVGNFFYEVAFETATVSADVSIPIDRTQEPVLKLYSQLDGALKDTAQFVAWLDHDQGGTIRTVARFANNSDLTAPQTAQREPMYVRVENFKDVFNGIPTLDEHMIASTAYNLANKNNSVNGFSGASGTLALDNKLPEVTSIIPTGTIGITPANGETFEVTFAEPMNGSTGTAYQPQLKLVDSSNNTVMSFRFESWKDSNYTTASFKNIANFDASTPQGTFTYFVSGGFDEAGNQTEAKAWSDFELQVRSKGPNIDSYVVTTYQSTTAQNSIIGGGTVDNQPFSPYVDPGVATITINFTTPPDATELWLNFYSTTGSTELASIPITISGQIGTALWNGMFKDVPVGKTGPTTYILRVYDDATNEASKRGSIVYDGKEPVVNSWRFSNVRSSSGKAYFSPNISSFAKIDVFGPVSNDSLKMRLINPSANNASDMATHTYALTSLSGGGYTISFDGKDTNTPQSTLGDGEYLVNVVDRAGNIGIPSGVNSQATATLVIDTIAPEISAITTYRDIGGSITPSTRFNPNVADTKLRIQVETNDPDISSSTILVKISAGSKLVRELTMSEEASPFVAEWDGKDSEGQMVLDGTYQVTVIDLAGNVSSVTPVDVSVFNSRFEVTDVSQVDKNHIKVTFSHEVNEDDAVDSSKYSIAPEDPLGLQINNGIEIDETKKVVTLPLTKTMQHDQIYTLTVAEGFRSIDEYPIAGGYNSKQFTADTQGPLIQFITYDGLTSQKKFNVVFDEQVDATTSIQTGNYNLVSGSETIQIDSVIRRADLKSVTITAFDDIVEDKNYTISVTGVEDLFGNQSDGNLAKQFTGQDITPPELTITAFSNPANEFDISVVVSANEDLSGAPTATITQSGGTAVSLVLNAGPNNRIFIGGAHLDMNYPGVATIKVTATDMSTNTGSGNMSFSTAYVTASVRASVASPDKRFNLVFEPGTLKQNSLVSVVPEKLSKVTVSANQASMIVSSVMAQLTKAQATSIRASVVEGQSANELIPIGTAYSVNIPAGRISGAMKASFKPEAEQLEAGTGLYRSDLSLGWKPVEYSIEEGVIKFEANEPGTFAIMKDVMAPRAALLTQVDESKPIREARPSFVWNIEELGSGLDSNSVYAILNNKMYPVMFDQSGKLVRFVPGENLDGGEYELSLKAADKAGNKATTAAIRFQLLPPIQIYEVVQYPNPARNRVNLRISTNRPDVDWGEIEVKIYDVAGHKVADSDNLGMRTGTNGTRRVQDITWDLRATGGKQVANGVYFAKITVRDPDNWNQKTKYVHKIAVLR